MFMSLYTCIFVYEFYLGYIIGFSIYDMLKQKEHMCKQIVIKILWTFEWLKMSHIFISPYHNHFLVDFNFNFLNMYIK
jgi:hypothetical protein